MDDLISKQDKRAVVNLIDNMNAISFYEANEHSKECYNDIRKAILAMPEQEPKTGHWIPVSSKRLPDEDETVIASTKYRVYPEAMYTKEYGWEWAYEAGADYWREIEEDVVAWMPLPKRYEPESEDEYGGI